MLADFRSVAAAQFVPAGGIVAESFPQRGAMSLVHSSMAASTFFTPRVHSRSINMRVPSRAADGSYACLSLTLSAVILLLISVALSGKLPGG